MLTPEVVVNKGHLSQKHYHYYYYIYYYYFDYFYYYYYYYYYYHNIIIIIIIIVLLLLLLLLYFYYYNFQKQKIYCSLGLVLFKVQNNYSNSKMHVATKEYFRVNWPVNFYLKSFKCVKFLHFPVSFKHLQNYGLKQMIRINLITFFMQF